MTTHHLYLVAPNTKVAAVTEWYSQALAPIDYHVMFKASESVVGIGSKGRWPNFWIRGHDGGHSVPTYVCFSVPSEQSTIQERNRDTKDDIQSGKSLVAKFYEESA